MSEWTCVIPGPPRQKGNAKRIVKFGSRAALVGDRRTIEAQSRAEGVAWTQRPAELITGALVVDVDFCFAIPKTRQKGKHAVKPGDPHTQKPDRGNLLKMIEDVLEGIAYANDCAIADGRVRKLWGEVDETRVTVRTVGAAPAVIPSVFSTPDGSRQPMGVTFETACMRCGSPIQFCTCRNAA